MSDTKAWVNFFEAAQIPERLTLQYARAFVDNRINTAMLGDLNKEILKDMSITAVGDVISILKHAKNCCDEAMESEMLSKIGSTDSRPKKLISTVKRDTVSGPSNDSPLAKRRYAAPETVLSDIVKLASNPVVNKRQLVPTTKVQSSSMTVGTRSVFTRLGESEEPAEVTQPIRLGNMRSDSIKSTKPSTIISLRKNSADSDLRPILKKSVSFNQSAKESSPDVSSTSNVADATLESDRLALKRKQSALSRLGPMSAEVGSKPIPVGDRKQLVVTRVGDRKVVVQKPTGITSRLGPKVVVAEASSTSTSVFSRLGRRD